MNTPEGLRFNISGNSRDAATPVSVTIGHRYHIEVRGQWKDSRIVCRPDGTVVNDNWIVRLIGRTFYCAARFFALLAWSQVGRAPMFMLMGRIDTDDGAGSRSKPFQVGFGLSDWEAPSSGNLILYPNDYKRKYGNNKGTLQVTVREE